MRMESGLTNNDSAMTGSLLPVSYCPCSQGGLPLAKAIS
jgi:hypothetical protein